ncbi:MULTISPECIES: hypothetical protein [unclassified Streptomyces]|uniref:hypothetical protein n=1 Tax=unclassified Streptomyces TaxID=2593676 RepID=UPI0022504D65|nr:MULTISPECIES: hypothetical protein [unclassified Streptomyces]WSP54316.1 hypothetical protein OG306_07925 [Streptomyces sp. NBC_01241]WSU25009.1 hypothetical protein OG508_31410 [Streptomyces sp. NBC_01108]MCX4785835.1 hypothetical protein [Streptomyces sp. NBC_01221]MCX4798306.1 hypothetical protein [Streptomyces sp. NBC_01242]WSJ39544.1 hypothetical protein OG772_28415 [Streptomyces sp. NBC_01321]
MRSTRRRTWALPAASVVIAGLIAPLGISVISMAGPSGAGASAPDAPTPEPAGSECRTSVLGSRVVAYCHNPYPSTDRVQLHTECRRWWDIDADATPVDVGPGQTVRLDDRCWKEVGSAWVTHRVQSSV